MGHKEKSPKIDGAISPYVEKDIISCIHICFFFLSIKFLYLGMCGTGEFGRFGLQHGRRAGLFSGNCVGLHGHHHDGGWVGGWICECFDTNTPFIQTKAVFPEGSEDSHFHAFMPIIPLF